MEDQIKQAVEKQLRSLNREYFSQKNLHPWIRECKDIYSPGHKDAFIGIVTRRAIMRYCLEHYIAPQLAEV